MSFKDRIDDKLRAQLKPTSLETIDETHLHEGHLGAAQSVETHFRVRIVSEAFTGRSRLERHRMVNSILAAELAEQVHALAIEARAPDE